MGLLIACYSLAGIAFECSKEKSIEDSCPRVVLVFQSDPKKEGCA